ncbi:MAG: hypothetical protein QOF49_76, partial [Chloroflexota bacterium]|nr:hypothetical protein [Chloroflexota bacterium]
VSTGADFLMGTIAGAMADRGDRKRMMFGADLGRALFTALIPLCDFLHGPTIVVILLVTAPLAILRGFFRAGYLASMPNLVGRSQLARGNGILETAYSAAFMLGPALAGFLVTVIGAAATLAIDAGSFGVCSVGLLLIRRDLKAPSNRPPSRMLDDIREGIVYVAHHPVLRTIIAVFATTSAVIVPVAAAMTFRIVRDLGQGRAAYGLALTGLGGGTLLGSLFASRLGPATNVARVLVVAILLMGVALIGIAITDSVAAIIGLTAVSGAGEAALVIVYVSVRAANSPDELVGRIASTARAFALGLMPIGSLIGGVLIDAIGGTATLVVLGTSMCALGLGFSQVRPLRVASLAPREAPTGRRPRQPEPDGLSAPPRPDAGLATRNDDIRGSDQR